MQDEHDRLEHFWTFDPGVPGVDADMSNPFARATRALAADGRPMDGLVLTLAGPDTDAGRDGASATWLGSFVHTRAGRVLFFPGTRSRVSRLVASRGIVPTWNQPFELDHFTLERNRASWHATTYSGLHLGKAPTLAVAPGATLWFGLSVASWEHLRPVARQTQFTYEVPARDARRRTDALEEAMSPARNQLVLMPPGAINQQDFLHFAVLVLDADAADYDGDQLAFPDGGPYVQHMPVGRVQFEVRQHRIPVSSSVHVQVTACRLPGTLTNPVMMTSQSEPSPR